MEAKDWRCVAAYKEADVLIRDKELQENLGGRAICRLQNIGTKSLYLSLILNGRDDLLFSGRWSGASRIWFLATFCEDETLPFFQDLGIYFIYGHPPPSPSVSIL